MFEVEWSRDAINQLADIWNRAADRDTVTAASHLIDRALSRDPANEGESRDDDRRVTFATPLGVEYQVFAGRRLVVVGQCWRHRTR